MRDGLGDGPGEAVSSVVNAARALLSVVLALALWSCGGREFRSERDAISHFREHRQGFERAAALFLSSGARTIEVAVAPPSPSGGEAALVQLARELRVTNISAVPGVVPAQEQWLEFTLAARLTMSTYGVIFVPEDHGPAIDAIRSYVSAPPRGLRLVRHIDDRWFYYEYE